MKLNPKKAAFGRHETFFLRYGWLTKGFWANLSYINDNTPSDIFKSDNAVVELGVGKNMVASIKYWLQATQLLTSSEKGFLIPTDLGMSLMGNNLEPGWDAYLEDEATLWLLHWLIASNATQATAFYWFFNRYHKTQFTQDELRTALNDFIKESISANTSAGTIKNDISVLTRMYSSVEADKKQSWDDILDSPMSQLGLIEATVNKEYKSSASIKNTLHESVVGFALAQIFESRQATTIPVEELIYSQGDWAAIGAVFRTTESQTLALIEEAIRYIPGKFEINESAGIHQVFKLEEVSPIEYLKLYFEEVKV
ncbi:DUF4007 family protein [Pseudoalteromonas neustonica]|uniref:DUF4007 family protein n=1 Tax=Pseudoalteromonas neustonica TaxID=1840331 RepID=A0ABU9TXL0_9GAMM